MPRFEPIHVSHVGEALHSVFVTRAFATIQLFLVRLAGGLFRSEALVYIPVWDVNIRDARRSETRKFSVELKESLRPLEAQIAGYDWLDCKDLEVEPHVTLFGLACCASSAERRDGRLDVHAGGCLRQ